ncbi:hypothetical protein M569_06310, partial [Genlisea aurea]
PLVVPFVHTGMQDVMPIGAKFPKIGKTITVLVGDPIDFEDIINKNVSRGRMYDAVAARIGTHLQKLKLQVEELAAMEPPKHLLNVQNYLDWETLGIENFIVSESDNSPLP